MQNMGRKKLMEIHVFSMKPIIIIKKKKTQKMILNDDADKFCELHVNSENSDKPYKGTRTQYKRTGH